MWKISCFPSIPGTWQNTVLFLLNLGITQILGILEIGSILAFQVFRKFYLHVVSDYDKINMNKL